MSQPLCIVIHGFTGSPREVQPLAKALSTAGYEVVAPLLPGHYCEKKRMDKATASDWIGAIEELTKRAIYEKRVVHLIGFSMGAMIAAIIASRHSIRTLVLLSPAVYIVTPNVLLTRSRRMVKLVRENRFLFSQAMRNEFTSMGSAPLYNVLQFRKVIRDAKKKIPYIDIPVCIVHGLEDEIVDPKSSYWIYKTVSTQEKEVHTLSNSGHLVCYGIEVNVLVKTVLCFLNKYT